MLQHLKPGTSIPIVTPVILAKDPSQYHTLLKTTVLSVSCIHVQPVFLHCKSNSILGFNCNLQLTFGYSLITMGSLILKLTKDFFTLLLQCGRCSGGISSNISKLTSEASGCVGRAHAVTPTHINVIPPGNWGNAGARRICWGFWSSLCRMKQESLIWKIMIATDSPLAEREGNSEILQDGGLWSHGRKTPNRAHQHYPNAISTVW